MRDDKRLVGELREWNGAHSRQPVGLGHGKDDRLAQQRQRRDAHRPMSDRRPDEGHVEAPASDVIDLLRDVQLMQPQFDVGVSLAVVGDRLGEEAGIGRRAHISDLDVAALATTCLARHRRSPLRLAQRAQRLLERQPTGDGEMHGPLGALKELGAELALQSLDLLRQRRLRDAEPLRRPAEVKLLGQHRQVSELTQLHEGSRGEVDRKANAITPGKRRWRRHFAAYPRRTIARAGLARSVAPICPLMSQRGDLRECAHALYVAQCKTVQRGRREQQQ